MSVSAFNWACREDCILSIEWERAHGLYTYGEMGDVFIQGIEPFPVTAGSSL
ncbi:hypothetical protein [Catenulispora pinisilvae]|uniref:hypothetical protein n=1 Tax=Catenulispora pinisilvae TaxID=2705253 RepID=UPI0018922164|nr:hypothetical protein [Catenulispora pinisilvae]